MAIGGGAHEHIGRTLRGKWTLEALLGVGGMAAVYAATHRNGGRAAIKLLHHELGAMAEVRTRFVREGYLANRVGHPAVVRALDDDVDDDGTPFLVMELVEGETLEQRAAEELMNAEELLAVAEQILEVLSAGHERGIVHQDLKPANLLVDNDGRVRVLDYGIARSIDDDPTTLKLRTTGTPSFMSPEQVRGDVVTGASDLYSLGATLFALATGRPPHVADTPIHLMLRIATESAPRVSELAPSLPRPLAQLIDRALRHEPDRRWASANAMAREVQSVREALGIPSSPLVLACRHGATQPELPRVRVDTTGSVRAIVMSDVRPAPAKPKRAVWYAASLLAVAMIAGLVAVKKTKTVPVVAPAAQLTFAPVETRKVETKVATTVEPKAVEVPVPVVAPPAASTSAPVKPAKRAKPKEPKKEPKPVELAIDAVSPYKDSPY